MPSWGAARLLEIQPGVAGSPRVALSANGDAVAVWVQAFDGFPSIWSRRYLGGIGWSGTFQILEGTGGAAAAPEVALDATGNALVAWHQADPVVNSAWGNRYIADTAWDGPQRLETESNSAILPHVSLNSSGEGMLVFQQRVAGAEADIWARHYSAGSWSSRELLDSSAEGAGTARVAVDADGNATAVWIQQTQGFFSIWANRYDSAGGWGTATLLESIDAGDAILPRVANGPLGSAFVTWTQAVGPSWSVWANRYASGSWEGALQIDNGQGNEAAPQLAVDANGNAVSVWTDGTGTFNVWVNRYTAGSGWGRPEQIETDFNHARDPQVAIDAMGSAMVIWSQFNNGFDRILASRYTTESGWGTPEQISDDGDAHSPALAIDADGSALAVWVQSDGTEDSIWANRFE